MRRWLTLLAALLLSQMPVQVLAGAASAGSRVSTPPPATKVVGGQYADPAHWPGFAAVGVRRPDGSVMLICGATMIGKRHALTAAHCIEEFDPALAKRCGDNAMPVRQMVLFPGLVDMTRAAKADSYAAVRATAHPDATCKSELEQETGHPTYDNDIAVIEVDRSYYGQVSALSLSPDTDPNSGLTAVAGLGTTERDESQTFRGRDGMALSAMSDRLLEAFIPVVPTDTCAQDRNGGGGVIGAHQICAGWVTAAPRQSIGDSCNGDSGGPLVAYDGAHRPYQVGLVSWGPSPCGQVGVPGVYTRTSAYAAWIKAQVKDVAAAKPSATINEAPTEAAGFKALEAQLAPAQGRITVDICDADSGQCGLTQLKNGEKIRLKVSSPMSGRLILIDSNADFQVLQVFPNAFESEAAKGFILAGQPATFPDDSLPFQIQAQPPLGASRLMAILAPPGASLEDFVASESGKSKGVNVTYLPGWDSETGSDLYAASLANQIDAEVAKQPADPDAPLPGWGIAVLNYEIVQ